MRSCKCGPFDGLVVHRKTFRRAGLSSLHQHVHHVAFGTRIDRASGGWPSNRMAVVARIHRAIQETKTFPAADRASFVSGFYYKRVSMHQTRYRMAQAKLNQQP